MNKITTAAVLVLSGLFVATSLGVGNVRKNNKRATINISISDKKPNICTCYYPSHLNTISTVKSKDCTELKQPCPKKENSSKKRLTFRKVVACVRFFFLGGQVPNF